jgi:hypothetical protein
MNHILFDVFADSRFSISVTLGWPSPKTRPLFSEAPGGQAGVFTSQLECRGHSIRWLYFTPPDHWNEDDSIPSRDRNVVSCQQALDVARSSHEG